LSGPKNGGAYSPCGAVSPLASLVPILPRRGDTTLIGVLGIFCVITASASLFEQQTTSGIMLAILA